MIDGAIRDCGRSSRVALRNEGATNVVPEFSFLVHYRLCFMCALGLIVYSCNGHAKPTSGFAAAKSLRTKWSSVHCTARREFLAVVADLPSVSI
jgi:hypothetical protein